MLLLDRHLTTAQILPNHPISPLTLTPEQTAAVILESAKPARERRTNIETWRRVLDHSNQPGIQAWGLQVHNELSLVDARVLPPPAGAPLAPCPHRIKQLDERTVTYGKGRNPRASTIPPNIAASGGWNLRDVVFTRPGAPLKAWSVLNFAGPQAVEPLKKFVTAFVSMLRTCGASSLLFLACALTEGDRTGLTVPTVQPSLITPDPSKMTIPQAVKQAYDAAKGQGSAVPQLILVALPNKAKVRSRMRPQVPIMSTHVQPFYENIKRIASVFSSLTVTTS